MTGVSGTPTLLTGTTPVRGSLRLNVSTSSPQIAAGSDFSIFVNIQNPFDVPITIHQVQTHIPVELLDVNSLRLDVAARAQGDIKMSMLRSAWESVKRRLASRRSHKGIAIAVGTDFDPNVERDFVKMSTSVERMGDNSSIVGVNFEFPTNPTPEELDQIFRRLLGYRMGVVPVTLQPGDSLVKQFVLRTRQWLLFTPLSHRFQIQVNYTGDRVDHTDTIAYEQSIRSTIAAMAAGACCGAILGAVLKNVSATGPSVAGGSLFRTVLVALLASMAVVVAFARKSAAQPIVSVEDFWGGALIGFTVGFFGFDQFAGLFGRTPSSSG